MFKPFQILSHNWRIKVGSLIVSLLLFWYVQDARIMTRIINVRVDRPELPDTLVVSSRIPSFMKVKIYGPREMMDFTASDFRIQLTNQRPGVGEILYVASIYPVLPEGLGAEYERKVPVILDREMKRTLPVTPVLDINLASGFRKGYTFVEPGALRVRGPAAIVSWLERIRTSQLVVSGSLPIFKRKVLINSLPEFVYLDQGEPPDVDIQVNLLPDDLDPGTDDTVEIVQNVPVVCNKHPAGISMSVDGKATVDVMVMAEDPDMLKHIKKDQFRAEVACPVYYDSDEKKIKPSEKLLGLPVFVNYRGNTNNVIVLDVMPDRLTLKFEKSAAPRKPYELRKALREHLIR